MTCLQQIQEQNSPKQEPTQLDKLFSFKDRKAYYRKNYLSWDDIERANQNKNPVHKKTTLLSSNAKNLLSPIITKLEKGEKVILNHKYISSITICERRHNQRIIKELETVLDIKYYNSITHNGKKYRYSYTFSYKAQKQENIISMDTSIETKMSRQNVSTYIYNNKDIEYIDLESNFLKNYESKERKEKFNFDLIKFLKDTSKAKKYLPIQRNKTTKSKIKAKIIRFNQYKTERDLVYHYPITQDDCMKIQSLSGRNFSLNSMNEILLDMSRRIDPRFKSKATFLSYIGKAFKYEKRDAAKISNENFKIKANITVTNNTYQKQKITLEDLKLPESIWGDICQKLIEEYDPHVYKNSFSKLIPIIDKESKYITLKASNKFIMDWIKSNYEDSIRKVITEIGMKLKEINV